MGDLPNRIRELRKQQGLTLSQLSDLVGLSDAQINRLEKGERELSVPRLLAFARAFKRPVAELLPEGADDHLRPEVDTAATSGFRRYHPSPPLDVKPWPIPLRDVKNNYSPHGCLLFGADFLDKFGIDPLQCQVIEVHDSSMDPTIPRGSACLVDGRKKALINSAIYAVERGADLFVRRVQKNRTHWHFLSEVSGHQEFSDRDHPDIIGRVIWTARMVDFGIEAKLAENGIH